MDRVALAGAAIVTLVLVGGFIFIASSGADTTGYVIFVSGPLVSSLVGAFLASKVRSVQATTDEVRHATDGLLTARLNSVDQQLAAASVERNDLASQPPAESPGADGRQIR
jgi:hypothetical protein